MEEMSGSAVSAATVLKSCRMSTGGSVALETMKFRFGNTKGPSPRSHEVIYSWCWACSAVRCFLELWDPDVTFLTAQRISTE